MANQRADLVFFGTKFRIILEKHSSYHKDYFCSRKLMYASLSLTYHSPTHPPPTLASHKTLPPNSTNKMSEPTEAPLLVVYGATGSTGKHLVTQALEAKLRVRAFVRTPSKVPENVTSNPNFSVYEGDITDATAVAAALEGATYAISVAGNKAQSADGIMEKMVRAIIGGMGRYGVRRFVFQAGAFSVPPEGRLPGNIKFMRPVFSRVFGIRHMVLDNDKVIEALKGSDVQWAVTMPGMLKEGDSKGKLKKVVKAGGACMFSDMAAFDLMVVQSESYQGMGLYPGY